MLQRSATIESVVRLLNDMLELDPIATAALFTTRVPCNKALADHPTIQVMSPHDDDKEYRVGILGIINGMFGCDSNNQGMIYIRINEDGKIINFEYIIPPTFK